MHNILYFEKMKLLFVTKKSFAKRTPLREKESFAHFRLTAQLLAADFDIFVKHEIENQSNAGEKNESRNWGNFR